METNDALDDKDSGPEVQLNIPASVMSRIEELMGGTEQFDSDEFDAVAYINRIFPTEQSLSGVEAAASRCEFRLAAVQHDIRRLVRAQHDQREAGHAALLEAQQCIAELAVQVGDIHRRAGRSEGVVREITSEMKQLDRAKGHLTAAISALNQLHMLAGGAASLRALAAARQYRALAPPLQAVAAVLRRLRAYRAVQDLAVLRDDVSRLRAQLAQQIREDFEQAFTGARRQSDVSQRTLSEACEVVDVLEPEVKRDLLKWFIGLQLQEYEHLFSPEQECAWLPHIAKRYTWLKKHLLTVEQTTGALFPPAWRISERIAHRFCEITRESLQSLMASRSSQMDCKMLLYAIQQTHNFELLLHKRFIGTEPTEVQGNSEEVSFEDYIESSEAAPDKSPWLGVISRCFEEHLSLYINSLDANLRALMDRFVQEAKGLAADECEGSGEGGVLSSCADLFLFYKKCLAQCASLSTGQPMLELSSVFAKYLREYASSVLQSALPRSGPTTVTNLVSNLHTFLKDEGSARFTKQEIARITSVITTSEYCLETTVHLEQKLKEKIDASLAPRIDLGPEQDLFHKTIGTCIQILVQDLELACEPALCSMAKISWLHFDTVGDQSSYVTQIAMHLNNSIPTLRDSLASSRKYFTQFCIRFASSFIPKFIQSIFKCKPISTVGSEQLLLDTHMLKTVLADLPSLGAAQRRPAPSTYARVVVKLMTKAEMILKLVMAPLDDDLAAFVAHFQQLLPDGTLAEFHKVLDMKGARPSKAQLGALDALFKQTRASGDD